MVIVSLYDLFKAVYEACQRPFLPGDPLKGFHFALEIPNRRILATLQSWLLLLDLQAILSKFLSQEPTF